MATEVLMPKLGLTMTEGTIEEWKFKEGDTVKKGDILFSVATDKLTNDVEAEEDGTLLLVEKWTDAQAQKAHLETPHMKQMAAFKPEYVADTKLISCTIPD